ncbi:glycoside hydrolase family 65 protein [Microbacterium sp. B2969]|uniref:Glycoside hydrolase family 65 protein n=1 Tax=Microbacterium alkaliflavum TaxID=3248839 RepID=A0ABW7Q5T1_9MICO
MTWRWIDTLPAPDAGLAVDVQDSMSNSRVGTRQAQAAPARREACTLCATPTTAWHLDFSDTETEDDRDRIGSRESLLTLSNGYLATRGVAAEDTDDGLRYPATYVAGIYNRLQSVIEGRHRADESLVNLPNWLPIAVHTSAGGLLDRSNARIAHDHRRLDMATGTLLREVVSVDPGKHRTRMQEERIVSMHDPHLAYLRVTVTPLNWSGVMNVESWIDAEVTNNNVPSFRGLQNRHLMNVAADTSDGGQEWLEVETTQSRIRIAIASRTEIHNGFASVSAHQAGATRLRWEVRASESVPVVIDKTVAIFTSRDHAISEPSAAAHRELAHALPYSDARGAHRAEWKHIWLRMRLETEIDASRHPATIEVQRDANLQLFHVAQTLSRHTSDADVGVSARGLHGEGYGGRVFWDELFVLPMLNLRMPELTRALLMYRYRRLPEARRLAESIGLRGALFPWQSGSDGREETPATLFNPRSGRWLPDRSSLQLHSGLAIAYSTWHYFQVTDDLDFLASYGAELITEIARFWSERAEFDPGTNRYHLRHMMGPDEFHDGYPDHGGEGIDDNAYVAVMASWVLDTALRAHHTLGGDANAGLWERLRVDTDELDRWREVSRRLYVPFLPSGLLAQFDDYEALTEFDFDRYRAQYGDIARLDLLLEAEDDTTNRYQVTKQADVLMLFYLFSAEELTAILTRLGYEFDPETIPATIEYYLARTTHGWDCCTSR